MRSTRRMADPFGTGNCLHYNCLLCVLRYLSISIHYGLAVMIIMHVFGFVSGAHANPCITLSCYFMGYIATDTMFLYLACQMVGGFFGYSMLLLMLPKEILDNNKPAVCLIEPMSSLSSIQIVAIEGVLTAILLLGWCALWDVRNGRFLDSVSIRMGFLVTACGFAGVSKYLFSYFSC